jgi:His-Xaa-Ser system radical SAM maturase HxsC
MSSKAGISFHILSNAQHFDEADIVRLSSPLFEAVTWGIPLYSHIGDRHDTIVAKAGAFERLTQSFAVLLKSGARVELRTVVLSDNLNDFPALSRFVATHLGFCVQWSVMQLENIGFAKNRFTNLYVDHEQQFASIAEAIDVAVLYGMPVSLFNFARCTVPRNYRDYAVASISDWKRKFPLACNTCSEQALCSGFFEWHPEAMAKVTPL